MSAYRDGSCAFCELGAREPCPRCQAFVCEVHGVRGGDGPYCAMCAKELRDDLEVLRFSVAVHDPPPDSRPVFRGSEALGPSLVQLLARALLAFQERRARRAFERRTPAQIAEWRRRAGVRVRGR